MGDAECQLCRTAAQCLRAVWAADSKAVLEGDDRRRISYFLRSGACGDVCDVLAADVWATGDDVVRRSRVLWRRHRSSYKPSLRACREISRSKCARRKRMLAPSDERLTHSAAASVGMTRSIWKAASYSAGTGSSSFRRSLVTFARQCATIAGSNRSSTRTRAG